MKTLLTIPLLLLLLGCGCNTTPRKIAASTLESVGSAARIAMESAADARARGLINDANWTKISEKHEKFRTAYNAACDAAAASTNAIATDNLLLLEADLINFAATFTGGKK